MTTTRWSPRRALAFAAIVLVVDGLGGYALDATGLFALAVPFLVARLLARFVVPGMLVATLVIVLARAFNDGRRGASASSR